MISLNFNIRNPWKNNFTNLWCDSYKTPFKNKFVELQLYKDSSILSFNFNLTARQSHAGLQVEVGLLGYCFDFNFYDSRHWDQTNNCWQVYDEGEA